MSIMPPIANDNASKCDIKEYRLKFHKKMNPFKIPSALH